MPSQPSVGGRAAAPAGPEAATSTAAARIAAHGAKRRLRIEN
jgi:hypothetical protein